MKCFITSCVILLAVLVTTAQAVTITHGSTTITMDFVTVGDTGNDGELSGWGAGGFGPDAIVGAIGYAYNIGKYEVTENQWDAVSGASSTDLLNDPGYWSGDLPVADFSSTLGERFLM